MSEPRRLWIPPAILLAIRSPIALGQFVFQLQRDGRAADQVMKIGDRRITGRTLLVGGTTILLLTGGRVYLTDQSRGMVISVDLKRRPSL